MGIVEKYFEALNSIPAPGAGCHPNLLSVANFGIMAGFSEREIFNHIRGSIPTGSRHVSDREICDAVNRAAEDHMPIILPTGERYQRYRPPKKSDTLIHNVDVVLQGIIKQSTISNAAAVIKSSPICIDRKAKNQTADFLSFMFDHDDLLFIGDRYEKGVIGENIRTAMDWIKHFQSDGVVGPFIIVNPLSGQLEKRKSGDGESLRGDNNVCNFRFCLVEFDNLSFEDQIKFWDAVALPVAALVHSAGKSIHAWINIQKIANICSLEDWQREIEQKLYRQYLIPLGVDPACSNPSRLSRLPGYFRDKTNKYQELLWLASQGKKDWKQ